MGTRDLVNEELLSAYLDDEVTPEERREVEQALAASAETRRLFEELKGLQASLRALPRNTLPDGFSERVLQAIQQRSPTPAPSAPPAPSAKPTWIKLATLAAGVAAVAALLVFALVLAVNQDGQPDVVERPPVTPGEQPLPDDTELVYDVRDRPKPKMLLVYDVAITPRGQMEKVLPRTLRQVGIAFNPDRPGTRLAQELEEDLLNSRFIGDVEKGEQDGGAAEEHEAFDVIEMVYVQGTGAQMDQLYGNLRAHEDVRVRLDVAMNPQERGVLNGIGAQTWSLATADAPDNPRSRAYRLEFRFVLRTGSTNFLGKFPTPSLQPRLVDPAREGPPRNNFHLPFLGAEEPRPGAVQLDAPRDAAGEQPHRGLNDHFEILVVVRNLKAKLPGDGQPGNE